MTSAEDGSTISTPELSLRRTVPLMLLSHGTVSFMCLKQSWAVAEFAGKVRKSDLVSDLLPEPPINNEPGEIDIAPYIIILPCILLVLV